MPLLADNRIPDTTLPDNQFQDGDIFYGDDANKVSDTLKAGVNANYNDIKRLANGELGTVIQPDGSIKYIRLNQDGVLEVSTDNQNYVTTSYAIQDEEGNIANHRPYIYFEGAYIVDNGARIEIHGFRGEQGLTGPQGEQGVEGERGPAGVSQAVAPQSGFYTLETDPDGNLYVCYPDDELAPTFTYEKDTGNLYVEIDGQQVLVGNIQGPQGVKGDPGVSPTVSQTQIADGWSVTITDATGPHTFTLTNGVSTTINVTTIEGGHTVTITDKDGPHAFNVMDGATGPAGFSPTVAVSEISGGHTVTITDSVGAHPFNVMDGADGDDGFSPTVETTPISGGTQVTITDAEGPHTFNVENGAGIPTGGTTGQYLRKTENGTEWSDIEAVSDIDDSQPQSTTTTFSAKSISDMFEALEDNVNAGDTALETKINAKPSINDTTPSATTTYSGNKIDSLIDGIIDDNDTTATDSTLSASVITEGLDAVKSIMKIITVAPSEWVNGVYTLNDDLITTSSYQEWLPPVKSDTNTAVIEAIQNANIVDYGQTTGQAQIICMGTVPTIEIQMRVIFRSEKVTWSEVEPQPTDTGIHYELNTVQETGNYWIDGKKIYRYVAYFPTNTIHGTGTNNVVDVSVLNIDKIVDLRCAMRETSTSQQFFLNNNQVQLYYHGINKAIMSYNEAGQNYSQRDGYVFIEYTRTTEQAVQS